MMFVEILQVFSTWVANRVVKALLLIRRQSVDQSIHCQFDVTLTQLLGRTIR